MQHDPIPIPPARKPVAPRSPFALGAAIVALFLALFAVRALVDPPYAHLILAAASGGLVMVVATWPLRIGLYGRLGASALGHAAGALAVALGADRTPAAWIAAGLLLVAGSACLAREWAGRH